LTLEIQDHTFDLEAEAKLLMQGLNQLPSQFQQDTEDQSFRAIYKSE
jgi:hypothetical protein